MAVLGRIMTPPPANPSVGIVGAPPVQAQSLPQQPITANSSVGYTGGLPVQSMQAVPQTGLIGSEAALGGGLAAAEAALFAGNRGSEEAIANAYNTAISSGNTAYNDATAGMNQGYSDASNRLTEYRQAMNNRNLNLNTSLGSDSVNAINQGVAGFDPYTQGGANAQKLYDDLTGVNGPQAQAAAQTTYQNSPALQYQMEQMQKATERSSAARGGLLSGRAGLELQRNAQGLASQDYFKNLAAVGDSANRGLSAASQVGNLRSNQAQMGAQLQGIGLQAQAQYEMQKEQTRADIANKLSGLAESRGINLGAMRTGLGQSQAATALGTGSELSSLRSNLATGLAGGRYGYGQDVAQGRTNAGMAMAQNATQAASSISQLLNQQGIGVSDMMNKDISNVTDMIYQSGMQDKIDMQNLAALINNINSGQATNLQQGYQDIGAAKAAGQLGVGNAVNSAITQGIASGVLKV